MAFAAASTESIKRRRTDAWFLLVCAIALFAGRWRLFSAPLHSDICTFALFGHEMLAGRPMYTDLWDRKPPLLYLTFGAAEKLVGYGRGEVLLVNLAATYMTLLGVLAIGRAGGRGGGFFAAGLWTLCAADLGLFANQPDPEAFINACVTVAVAMMLFTPPAGWRQRSAWFAGVGALLGAATMYKHNVAMLCGTLLLGYCMVPEKFSPAERGDPRALEFKESRLAAILHRFADACIAGSVIVSFWACFLGHAYVAGRLPATVDVLFRQNLAYSGGSVGHNLLLGLRPDRLFPPFLAVLIGPAVLVLLAAIVRPKLLRSYPWIMIVAWTVGAWMTIVFTGHTYPHYYVLWLPIACVCGGWAGALLWSAPNRWPRVIVVIVLLGVVVRQLGQFTLSPEEWVRRQFPYYDVAAQNDFGLQMGRLLRPDESFYELGEDNTLYFLSRHSPPTGLLFIDPLIYGTDTRSAWTRLMSDFARRPPDMVVLSSDWLPFFPPDAPIFHWLRANYDPYPTPVGRPIYRLFVRRGGTLERRLNGL